MPKTLKLFLYQVQDNMDGSSTDWGLVRASSVEAAAKQVRETIADQQEFPMTEMGCFDGHDFLMRILPCAGWNDHNVAVSDANDERIFGFSYGEED